uniref:Uncharacterized protein n=1 Tax=Babesia bovis TaxID=5865 RepID=S6B240_BABBO|nr:hypothetical protein [Babesia bovis]
MCLVTLCCGSILRCTSTLFQDDTFTDSYITTIGVDFVGLHLLLCHYSNSVFVPLRWKAEE